MRYLFANGILVVTATTSFFVANEIKVLRLFFLLATLMFSSKNFSKPAGSINVSSEGRDKFTEKVCDFFIADWVRGRGKREERRGGLEVKIFFTTNC